MPEYMNPTYPQQRGCFIEVNEKTGKCSVVDYPTWSSKNGRYVCDGNSPIPEGKDWQKSFDSKEAALEFCKSENYVVCSFPKTDEELAEIARKREAYWAKWREEGKTDDLDPFAEFDI